MTRVRIWKIVNQKKDQATRKRRRRKRLSGMVWQEKNEQERGRKYENRRISTKKKDEMKRGVGSDQEADKEGRKNLMV